MLIVLGISAMSAKAETLTVTSNNSSGINYSSYTATRSDGTVLGFYRSGSTVYFCGAITNLNSISVPDSILISSSKYAVNTIGYHSNEYLDLDEANNLNEMIIPATTTNIRGIIPSTISDLHIAATDVPSLYKSNCISNSTTVWVPQSAFASYQNAVSNIDNNWNGKDVHYEGWEPKGYTVNVKSAGSLANELLKVIDQWTDVDELTVIGTLNAEDMKMFSRMTQLRKLDLSQTDIKEIGGCAELMKLQIVVLPSTVTKVTVKAFASCQSLQSINIPNVVSIEDSAFYYCPLLKEFSSSTLEYIGAYAFALSTRYENYYDQVSGGLTKITFPNVKEIGEGAFACNMNLSSANVLNVQKVGRAAFANCNSISEINLSNANELGSHMFYMDSRLDYVQKMLRKVSLSNSLEVIPSRCFYGCTSLVDINIPSNLKSISLEYIGLNSISLPEGLTTIDALNLGALETASIPSTVTDISSSAFSGCSSLKDLYCYSVVPINTKAFNTDYDSYYALNPSGITLHVPAFSIAAYKLDDNWYKFGKIVPIDANITNITISQDFSIYEYTGLSEKVNLNVLSGYDNNSNSGNFAGHLTVSASDKWNIGEYLQTQSNRYNSDYFWDDNDNEVYTYNYYNSTLIPYNEMSADNVTVKYSAQTNRWNFISFPFDVNVSDIQYPEGTLWVIRKYSGEDRAKMTGNTWQNMTNGMTLKAGEGYILHCTDGNTDSWNSSYVEFTFKAVNNTSKNNIFAYQDVAKPLSKYASDLAHNRNWNLVGNPYPCFYDTRNIEHNGVITVWNGNGYTAYSLLDDQYILRPHESFFVQCPADATSMTFKAEGRQHTYEANSNASYAKAARVASANNRQVFNLTLSGAEYTDKARVVINESAKLDYEISCDASKFMSSNTAVPQIYVIENSQKMAIDERPLSSGSIVLGMYIGEAGDYTIGMSEAPANVILTDNATGKTVNLSSETYTFSASQGTSDNRFTIQIGDATGIEGISADVTEKSDIYSISCQKLSAPQKGINIINGNKILVK